MTEFTTLDDAIRHRLRAVLAPLRVVYGVMVGSILVYWLVVQAIRKVGQIPRGRDVFASVDWLRYPLYVLGVAACVALVAMRRRLFDPERVIRAARGQNLPELLAALSYNQVLVFAVAEVPVILGLALYFVGGYLVDFYLLAGLSGVAFALAYPSAVEWEQVLVRLRASRPELFEPPGPSG
jgi:hypothetical protein